MANCRDVSAFLDQVRARSVTAVAPPALTDRLVALDYVRILSADQVQQLQSDVDGLAASQAAIQQEAAQRAALAGELTRDVARDHSILFHLHGQATQAQELQAEADARAQLDRTNADLSQKEQAFNELLGKRALLDSLTPYGSGSIGLTVPGAVAQRDLVVRLYRYGDTDFDTYVAQTQHIDQELANLGAGAAAYAPGLAGGIPGGDPAYLWAIAIGLAKSQPSPQAGLAKFLQGYAATAPLSQNVENRLMASEILAALPQPPGDAVATLEQLLPAVRKIGVPAPSALGVAAVVLFGRRADGTFATDNVQQFLQLTRSYESAALLGITNVPVDTLAAKFRSLRTLFGSWGYQPSEDTELASAYLAVSEYAPEQVSSKLAILAKGLLAYLQYPLVAAAILTAVADLEANETLNLVEKAYGIIGRRAVGLSQGELICLAVRMVHGIRNELVGTLDATAAAATAPAGAVRSGFYGPRFFFVPIVIAHGGYFSTYSGVGGVHPGHVHGLAPGFGGAGIG